MSKSIKEIKDELNNIQIDEMNKFIAEYSSDERAGVTALVKSTENI